MKLSAILLFALACTAVATQEVLLIKAAFGQQPNGPVGDSLVDEAEVVFAVASDAGNGPLERFCVSRTSGAARLSRAGNVDGTEAGIHFSGGALSTPAAEISHAIVSSESFGAQLWLKTDSLKQTGPARILSISGDTSNRNLTIGQNGDQIEVRIRTTRTSRNGIPAVSTKKGTLKSGWTHVGVVWQQGVLQVYVNGGLAVTKSVGGRLADWDVSYPLVLGNEATGDRPWLGHLKFVHLQPRPLSHQEMVEAFSAGPDGLFVPGKPEDPQELSLFEKSVAPILADKCLECHDSANHQGGLDLSRREYAIAGGDSGSVLVAGNAGESALWQLVDSGEMPAGRPALDARELGVIKEWINQGADFSIDFVDPAVYVHGGGDDSRWVSRLTRWEYANTVRDLLGVEIYAEAVELLPPEKRADGFSNTAYNLAVDLGHIEAYGKLADIVVGQMDVLAFADRYSKSRRFTDQDVGAMIERLGKRLLRGPLREEEVIIYRGISTTVAGAGGSYEEAVALIIKAMLQSPRFVYRIERQLGNGQPRPLNQYELANRMSYILWGGPPDEELFAAAERGELIADAAISKQVDRMVASDRFRRQGRRFVSEWLNLPGLDNLQPGEELFPDWDPVLAKDMRHETMAYFEHVALEKRLPLSRLLDYPVTFASPRLAQHYGLDCDDSRHAWVEFPFAKLQRIDLKDSDRAGVLTHGSVLTIGGDNASMVTRGLFVLHDLLRGVVKDPPPCVNTTPVPTQAGLTQRDIATARVESEACGGCHRRFEPLAFGLERFDGIGQYSDVDRHGNALRQDGIVRVPGARDSISYATTRELVSALAVQPRVAESLTWKLTQFALGRPLGQSEAKEVGRIHVAASNNGGTYQATLKAIILSDLVRFPRTERR